jgi:hypothetical protein
MMTPSQAGLLRYGAGSTGGGKVVDRARDLYLRHHIDGAGLNETHVLIVTGGKRYSLT